MELLEELVTALLLEEVVALDTLDELIDELDFTELELVAAELETPQLPPTTPKGEGCAAQVELAIQLLPFS